MRSSSGRSSGTDSRLSFRAPKQRTGETRYTGPVVGSLGGVRLEKARYNQPVAVGTPAIAISAVEYGAHMPVRTWPVILDDGRTPPLSRQDALQPCQASSAPDVMLSVLR